MSSPTPDRPTQQAQQRIAAGLAEIDYALPGSIATRMMRCGTRGCRCKADVPQLHGPYIQWTRKIGGKTATKLLTPQQLARYQPWLDNARRLRDLVSELETLTTRTVERAEGWGAKTPPRSAESKSQDLPPKVSYPTDPRRPATGNPRLRRREGATPPLDVRPRPARGAGQDRADH